MKFFQSKLNTFSRDENPCNQLKFSNLINLNSLSSSAAFAQLLVVAIVVGSAIMLVMSALIHFAFFDFLPATNTLCIKIKDRVMKNGDAYL